MTESEWLSSNDPAALLAYVRATATERQLEWLAEAWHTAAGCFSGSSIRERPTAERLSHYVVCAKTGWGNRTKLQEQACASVLRDLWGNPFRPVRCECDVTVGYICDLCHDLPQWLAWNDYTVPRLVEAALRPACGACKGTRRIQKPTYATVTDKTHTGCGGRLVTRSDATNIRPEDKWCERCWTVVSGRCVGFIEHGCDACNSTGVSPAPDWSGMPLIADALEEAGATCTELLMHLRGQERVLDFATVGGQGTEDMPPFVSWRSLAHGHFRGCFALALLEDAAKGA